MKKETWSLGKNSGTVITDSPEGLSQKTGHGGAGAFKYYGGALICESIWRRKDAILIAAAPDLLESCKSAKALLEAQGISENSRIGGEQFREISEAIKKAEQ